MAGAGLGLKVLGIAAGIVGKKASVASWKVATGRKPPANSADPDVNWREAAAWAAVSGAIGGLMRLAATRGVSGYWRKSTGEIPENIARAAP